MWSTGSSLAGVNVAGHKCQCITCAALRVLLGSYNTLAFSSYHSEVFFENCCLKQDMEIMILTWFYICHSALRSQLWLDLCHARHHTTQSKHPSQLLALLSVSKSHSQGILCYPTLCPFKVRAFRWARDSSTSSAPGDVSRRPSSGFTSSLLSTSDFPGPQQKKET